MKIAKFYIDPTLFGTVAMLIAAGLFILYSAGNQSMHLLVQQIMRLLLAFGVMLACAQISPRTLRKLSPYVFLVSLALLAIVLVIGTKGKGAQRWLGFGPIRFQPSELMKLTVPMVLAWFLHEKQLPPKLWVFIISVMLMMIPTLLIAKQPDLGTAIMVLLAGAIVLFLAGMRWWLIIGLLLLAAASGPIIWHYMHEYQRQRVMTFFNPERDPLGSGYHIIQSKIAIGSGGIFGKGWLNGTQSHLEFLPEHATDFIFAVVGEELGLLGCLVLISLFLLVTARGIYISMCAQDTYSRLLAGSLSLMFFFSMYVNVGMVTGIFPVVGLPLPLVSYGGTSMVIIMAGFGMIMSIHTHRRLYSS